MTYLKAENQILRRRLPDHISLTQREKNRLVRFARNVGSALNELAMVVHPGTIRRWIREAAAKPAPIRKGKTGRPPTATRNTVKNILKRNGLETGPKRGPGTWDEFVTRHATRHNRVDFYQCRNVAGLYFAFNVQA